MNLINLSRTSLLFLLICTLAGCQSIGLNLHPQPVAAPLLAKPGSRPIEEDWLVGLSTANTQHQFPSSISWLNDHQLIYSLPTKDLKNTEIETLDINTNIRKQLGEGSQPKPSPDGNWIAFIKKSDDKAELWVMTNEGTRPKRLFEIPPKVFLGHTFYFAWSPDSKSLAVSHQQFVEEWERDIKADEDKSKSSAVDADHLKTAPPISSIHIIDRATSKSRCVASIEGSVRYLSWMPNGTQLLLIENQDFQTLTTFTGFQQFLNPVASPDGQKVAILYDADNPEYDYLLGLGIVSISSSKNHSSAITRLSQNLKPAMQQWSKDSKKIYALRIFGGYTQLYVIEASSGVASQLTDAPKRILNYALSPDGSKLAWIGKDFHATQTLNLAHSDGSNAKILLTDSNVPEEVALSEIREFEWDTVNYPARMRGILVLPLNYQQGKRYPLVVDIHGGGVGAFITLNGAILSSTPLEWQLWASKGYAVFIPEFRSSGAFGSLAITRDHKQEHDLVNQDINDIVAGVDELISRGIVDSKRTAVVGFSAGANRANWLTVATHRFSAVISHDGWADDYLGQGIYLWPAYKGYGGTPLTKPEYYQKNSPTYHALGASTPTLFLMGNPKLGGLDDYDSVRWLYNALKQQGVDTQYIYYPDEGHVFEREANRKDALDRAIKWLEKYLKSS